MKLLPLLSIIFLMYSCGNSNFLEQSSDRTKKIRYTSALSTNSKREILESESNVIHTCDIYNKAEFIFITRSLNTYYIYLSDGVNKLPLTLKSEDKLIETSNSFYLYHNEEGEQYLESSDFIISDNNDLRLQISDKDPSIREINIVKINENDFTEEKIETLYELVNCEAYDKAKD